MNTKSVKIIYAILAVLAFAILIFFAAFASGCEDNGQMEDALFAFEEDVTDEDFTDEVITEPEEELPEGLTINLSEITSTPKFFRTAVDGVNYQVIAAQVNGTYRTAFDTCKNCHNHYSLQGSTILACNGCTVKINVSQLGNSFNGCGPIAITASNRVVTDTVLIISNTYLTSNVNLFKNWKW